ncbi:MAG: ribosome biogenesis GTP-binding protein YihA/YsxC [Campylobacterales bacterium]|nr:ribosome biogenesis GTP-binding protein YihA/YsxC [Campylobacterales bacterium]
MEQKRVNLDVSFVTSAPTIEQAPPPNISEVVFLGRSNVGKSSLINSIANRKNLAKSSSTPGKTKLINFFDAKFKVKENKFEFRFVDLPGFGYAKVSKAEKQHWEEKLTEFLYERASIRVFLRLVDARHVGLAIDNEVENFLKSIKKGDQKIFTIFTKFDKLKSNEKQKLKNKYPDGFFTSSEKKIGTDKIKEEIIKHIFGEIL